MGIRIHRNTWSAPLQFIDCWLPPEPVRPPLRHPLSQAAKRFLRAGWLNHRASNDEPIRFSQTSRASTETEPPSSAAGVCPRHTVTPNNGWPRTEPRVLLTGRLSEVCAELDRLVELEARGRRPRS